MTEIKSRLKGVANRNAWAARGASFVAKAKATKVVWFPPKPAGSAQRGASTAKEKADPTRKAAKKVGKRTTKKPHKKTAQSATGAARKASKKASKKASGPAEE